MTSRTFIIGVSAGGAFVALLICLGVVLICCVACWCRHKKEIPVTSVRYCRYGYSQSPTHTPAFLSPYSSLFFSHVPFILLSLTFKPLSFQTPLLSSFSSPSLYLISLFFLYFCLPFKASFHPLFFLLPLHALPLLHLIFCFHHFALLFSDQIRMQPNMTLTMHSTE